MKCTRYEFRRHFREYANRFFTLHPDSSWHSLNEQELFLLKTYGLPDCGLPFFNFDFSLQYLRSLDLEDALFILGSAIDSSSREYIYIAEDHSIRVVDQDQNTYFVNSSLESLMNCIYTYSTWLEDIEQYAAIMPSFSVDSDEIFEIYYTLRNIDKEALSGKSIWYQIISTELKIQTPPTELV